MKKSIITKLLLGGFLASTVVLSNIAYGYTVVGVVDSADVRPCKQEVQERLKEAGANVDFRKVVEDIYQEHMLPYAEIVERYKNLFSSVRALEKSGIDEDRRMYLVGIDHKVLGNLKRCQETGYLRLDNTPGLSEDYFDFLSNACNDPEGRFFREYFKGVHTVRLSDYQFIKLYEKYGNSKNPNVCGENISRMSGTKFFEISECDLGKYFKNNSSKASGLYSNEYMSNYNRIYDLEKFMGPIKIRANTLIIPDWLIGDLSKNNRCSCCNKEAFRTFMRLIDVNSVKHIIVFSDDLKFKVNIPGDFWERIGINCDISVMNFYGLKSYHDKHKDPLSIENPFETLLFVVVNKV